MTINRETFEAWLFAQPKGRTFDYSDTHNCLICKFYKETTNLTANVGGYHYDLSDGEYIEIPNWLKDLLKPIGDRPSNKFSPITTFDRMQDIYSTLYGNPEAIPLSAPQAQVDTQTTPSV
jgi:hypothetical protein